MNILDGDIRDRRGLPVPFSSLVELWPLDGWQEVERAPSDRNENFRLTTGDGIFYLRRSYRSKSLDDLTPQLVLVRLLHMRGLPVPVPVSSTEGLLWAEVDGGLWVVTPDLPGSTFDDSSMAHLQEMGRMLARYHATVADLQVSGEAQPLVELQERIARPESEDPLRKRAERVVNELTLLAPALPRLIVHGTARRRSLLFDGDDVVGLLDFDNAHPDVRVFDLAVAVHDVGKVYTAGAENHSVDLDLDRVTALMSAYCEEGTLTMPEAAALPLLIEANRLKRALEQLDRVGDSETLSDTEHAKVEIERNRLAWLDDHRRDLELICATGLR